MDILSTLTEEQKKLIPVVKDEWFEFCYGGENTIDKEAAIAGITWLYEKAGYTTKPEVLFVDGPIEAQEAAQLLMYLDDKKQLSEYKVEDFQPFQKIYKKFKKVLGKPQYTSYGWCDLSDAGWVAYYDLLLRLEKEVDEDMKAYLEYLRSGVFMTIFLEGWAIAVKRPISVGLDDRQRLHNENGPAMEFENGETYWFWHGTSVNEQIILRPETITKKQVLGEKNSEVSRAMAEKLGYDKYMQLLGVKLVSVYEGFTPQGELCHYELYDFKKRQFELMPRLLKMESPSLNDGSRPYYIEPVPHTIATAQAARKWQWRNPTTHEWPTVEECNKNPELVFEWEA